MPACPLCILGLPQEDHTPEAWFELARNQAWQALVAKHWLEHPGVIPEQETE